MVDYGVLRRTHYVSITDTYDPLSNRRAFYDSSYALPPSMCECYVADQRGRTPANLLYMLRSGMMGWCTIMCDTTRWTPEQHVAAKREFALYKERLRPLIAKGNLYHISPRPDGVQWDGMQYFDPATRRGALFAFRGSTAEDSHTFQLKGLDPASRYRVTFEDGSAEPTTVTGKDLMDHGLEVRLGEPDSSEIVLIDRAAGR
jgi:alpha-galactosidase